MDSRKLRVLSAVLVALVLAFFVYSYGIVSASFKRTDAITFSSDDRHHVVLIREKVNSHNLPLRSINEEIMAVDNNSRFAAPRSATEAERIAWLMRNLPRLDIFKPDDGQFHSRVLRFFDSACEIRVFMTWISPAESFGARELLSLESLFKAHPKGCLMMLSRTLDTPRGYAVLRPLADRGFKVHAVTPDLSFLVDGTPAEGWLRELKRGNRDPGIISLAQNLSNLMRLVVLYKYGGVYLDTDFVVVKPLTGLRNSIGAQSVNESGNWTRLNNAVLVFDMSHPLLLSFIDEFALTFDGSKWGYNGPYLVSRVARNVSSERPGFQYTVLPPIAFYPVDWNKIGGLFQRPKSEAHSRWVRAKLLQLRGGETYGIHLWNKQSCKLLIEEGSVMGRLISDHCVICKDIYNS